MAEIHRVVSEIVWHFMKIWLVKFEEELPIDEDFRPRRMSMLAEELVGRGHSVVRWASDFSHELGRPRFNKRNQVRSRQVTI